MDPTIARINAGTWLDLLTIDPTIARINAVKVNKSIKCYWSQIFHIKTFQLQRLNIYLEDHIWFTYIHFKIIRAIEQIGENINRLCTPFAQSNL